MSTYNPFGTQNGTNHLPNGTETFNRLVVDGNYIDGSWELSIFVEDLDSPISVRVLGDLPLGGLMHRIVEKVKLQQSWSDHAIWWADRNMWLLHSRTTLDQYGIQSDARLVFRRMHNPLKVVLPSLTSIVLPVNYASRVFSVVLNICKELNIRHSEELSLTLPITKSMLKSHCPQPTVRPSARRSTIPINNSRTEELQMHKAKSTMSPLDTHVANPYATLNSNAGTMMRFKSDNSLDQERFDLAKYADCAMRHSARAVFADNWLTKPKTLTHKARLNSGWLDSSRSLLEQGVIPKSEDRNAPSNNPPTLYLCFKYYTFYDLILKYDSVRIHQLYEQARWSLLSGLFDCTEDEMVVFAAYQLQAELQSSAANQALNMSELNNPNPYANIAGYNTISSNYVNRSPYFVESSPDMQKRHYLSPNSPYCTGSLSRISYMNSPQTNQSMLDGIYNNNNSSTPIRNGGGIDEVDELLSELEQSCGVKDESDLVPTGTLRLNSHGYDVIDIPEIPSLEGNIKVFRDRSLLLKRYIAYWAIIREDHLSLYRSQTKLNEVLSDYSLRDCTVIPDVSVAHHKFLIKLSVRTDSDHKLPNGNGMVNYNNNNNTNLANPIREDLWLRLESAEQYASWLAACRLGSQGKTLASKVAYNKEVEAILELIRLQKPGPAPVITPAESTKYLGDLSDFSVEHIIRKARSKNALRLRITEAHANIRDLSLLEAKYKYIQAWQRLTSFGRSYFIVEFEHRSSIIPNSNTGGLFSAPVDTDIIGLCPGRIEVIGPQTDDILRSWNFSDLRSWNVNWDAEKVILEFRNHQISFHPLSTNCKTILEFIGGYVFLSQRNLEKSQEMNERLFHRLTGVTD